MPPRDRAEDIVHTVGITFTWIICTIAFVWAMFGPNREAPTWPLGVTFYGIVFVASTAVAIWWWKGYLKQLREEKG